MIVALTVLALLMLIGGLAAVVQGIPFVRLEVGWTMVIAGTVGASGGAVLLGITAAVARLARIERALSERAPAARAAGERFAADPAETGTAPVRGARSEPVMQPVLPPIPFPAVAPSTPEPRPAEPTGLNGGAALAAGAAVAAAGLAASELRLTRAEDPDLPAGRHEPALQDPALHEPALHEPAPQEPVMREPASYEPGPHRPDPELHEPLPPTEEPRPVTGDRHDAPPPPAPEPVPPAPEPVADASPQEPPHEDPSDREPPLDEPPGKTVIGTYDSGGNTYTMYADGTIDAETPAGRFHFASIEELKAFRGAGGEGAARGARAAGAPATASPVG